MKERRGKSKEESGDNNVQMDMIWRSGSTIQRNEQDEGDDTEAETKGRKYIKGERRVINSL